jgi:hypothetical protein
VLGSNEEPPDRSIAGCYRRGGSKLMDAACYGSGVRHVVVLQRLVGAVLRLPRRRPYILSPLSSTRA